MVDYEKEAFEITKAVPVMDLVENIRGLIADPRWRSPQLFKISNGVAIQVCRLLNTESVGGSVEILVREDVIDSAQLVSIADSRRAMEIEAEEYDTGGGEFSPEKQQAYNDLTTSASEIPLAAPVANILQGIIAAEDPAGGYVDQLSEDTHTAERAPRRFGYAFTVDSAGEVKGKQARYNQGRENPFDTTVHVFYAPISLKYTIDDLSEQILSDENPNQEGENVGSSPS